MRTTALPLAATLVALCLSACASITSAPSGPLKLGMTSVQLGRNWSDITAVTAGKTAKVRVLSIDGPLLNRLYLSDGLVKGDSLLKAAVKEKPMPTIRAGMTSAERMEFVADSVTAMGYLRVATAHPRPAKIGVQSAVRFDITAQTTDGLDIAGAAETAEVGGKTYVILYLAPAEHYFAATLPEVEKVMASAAVVG